MFATTDRATGEVSYLRSKQDLMPGTSAAVREGRRRPRPRPTSTSTPACSARRPDQLTQSAVRTTAYGWTVELAQSFQGVPVFGLPAARPLDKDGDLTSVNGFAAPNMNLFRRPAPVREGGRRDRAVASVTADPPGHDGKTATKGSRPDDPAVYRTGSIRGAPVRTSSPTPSR